MPLPWGGSIAPPAALQAAVPHGTTPDPVAQTRPSLAELEPNGGKASHGILEPAASERSSVVELRESHAVKEPMDYTMEVAAPTAAAAAASAVAAPESSALQGDRTPLEERADEGMVEEEPSLAPVSAAVTNDGEDRERDDAAVVDDEEQMASEAVPRAEAPPAVAEENNRAAAEIEEEVEGQPLLLLAEDVLDNAKASAANFLFPDEVIGSLRRSADAMEDEVMSEFSSNADDCTNLMVAPMDDEVVPL
jgi:hypothetical protein